MAGVHRPKGIVKMCLDLILIHVRMQMRQNVLHTLGCDVTCPAVQCDLLFGFHLTDQRQWTEGIVHLKCRIKFPYAGGKSLCFIM